MSGVLLVARFVVPFVVCCVWLDVCCALVVIRCVVFAVSFVICSALCVRCSLSIAVRIMLCVV